jgi:hypothetical protein
VAEDGSRQRGGSWSGRSPSHVGLEAIRRVVSITSQKRNALVVFVFHRALQMAPNQRGPRFCIKVSRTIRNASLGCERRFLRRTSSQTSAGHFFHFDSHYAYLSFPRSYAEYKLTQLVDSLRRREHKRLKRSDEVYVDYTGASLYPESLVCSNSIFLHRAVLGNAYSSSTR